MKPRKKQPRINRTPWVNMHLWEIDHRWLVLTSAKDSLSAIKKAKRRGAAGTSVVYLGFIDE